MNIKTHFENLMNVKTLSLGKGLQTTHTHDCARFQRVTRPHTPSRNLTPTHSLNADHLSCLNHHLQVHSSHVYCSLLIHPRSDPHTKQLLTALIKGNSPIAQSLSHLLLLSPFSPPSTSRVSTPVVS